MRNDLVRDFETRSKRDSRRACLRLLCGSTAVAGLGPLYGCASRMVDAVPAPQALSTSRTVWPPDDFYAAPDLSGGQVVRQRTGIRPYRRGSVRVESQQRLGKMVVHNYGHGGAGITLAPASSIDAISLIEPHVSLGESVAVLGAGVVGMTTASLLLDRGYRVTLYTDRITPDTTSDVAGGQFAPATVAVGSQARSSRWMDVASAYYLRLVGKSCGVDRVINFTVGSAGRALRKLPEDPFQRGPITRLPIDGVSIGGHAYETLVISPPLYMPWLMDQLMRRGAKFRIRHFDTAGDFAGLPETAVINCLGLGAKSVFDDEKMTPIRGRLVMLKPQQLGYLLSHRQSYLFSRPDAVVLGGTYEHSQVDTASDPRVTQTILDRHRDFFATA